MSDALLFEASPVALVLLDRDLAILRANAAALGLFGLAGAPASLHGLFGNEGVRRLRTALDAPGTRVLGDLELHGRWYDAQLSVVGDARLVALHDVTARRQSMLEAEQAALRLMTAIDAAPLGALEYELRDDDLFLIRLNRTAEQVLSIRASELRGLRITEAFPALAATEIPLRFREVARDGTRVTFDALPYGAPGTPPRYFDVYGFQTGSQRMAVIFREVTPDHLARERLRVSEQRFAGVFHSSSDYIVITRMSDGTFLEANDAFERMTGWKREEAIGRRAVDLGIWPDPANRPKLVELIERDGKVVNADFRLGRRDGSAIDCLLNCYRLDLDGVPCMVSVARDVTPMKRALAALEQSETRYEAIYKSAPYPLVLVRLTDDRWLEANAAAIDLLGYPRDKLIGGREGHEFEIWWNSADRQPAVQRLLAEGQLRELPAVMRSATGARIDVVLNAVLLTLDGAPCALVHARDVTETLRLQAERQQTQDLLSNVFDMLPEPLALLDHASGRFLEVNRAWTEHNRVDRDAVIGRTALDLGVWLSSAERAALRSELERTGELRGVEVTFRTPDGRRTPSSVSARLFDTPSGPRSIWLSTNIEQRRRAEERMRATLENTPGIAVQWYDRAGVIRYWNPASATMFGVEACSALGRRVDEVVHAAPASVAAFDEALRQVASRNAPFGPAEFSFTHPDGGKRWVSYTVFQIPGDADEPFFVCMDVDITDLKRAERRSQDSEAKFRAFFDKAPFAIAVNRLSDGSYLEINEAFLRLTGLTESQVLGKTPAQAGLSPDPQQGVQVMRTLLRDSRVENVETASERDGQRVHTLYSSAVVDVGGEKLVLSSAVDISRQKQAEAALQHLNDTLEQRVSARTVELQRAMEDLLRSEKLAALGRLVAGVAHELNTPIGNSVLVASSLHDATGELREAATQGLRKSEFGAYLQTATASSELLLRNLRRAAAMISSFKQVAVDQTSEQRRRFELQALVEENITTLQPTLRGTGIRIERDIEPGVELDSYPGPLGQVLTNLVNNAVTHGFDAQGPGVIRVSGGSESDGVALHVHDDGRGIPPEHLPRIFDPFFTTRLGRGGSGLGLHIVHSLVTDVLGGRVTVHSAAGSGTRFSVWLPRVAPQSTRRTA